MIRKTLLAAGGLAALSLTACAMPPGSTDPLVGFGPNPPLAEAAEEPDPDRRRSRRGGLAGRRRAQGAGRLHRHPLRRGPRPSALALRAAQRRRAGRRRAASEPSAGRQDRTRASRASFQKMLMKKVGSAKPSPNKIFLLRDADGDGVAETPDAVRPGPDAAVRHDAGRRHALRRQRQRRGQLPLRGRPDRGDRAPATKVFDLPGAADQPPLDQERRRQPRRHQALRHRRLQLERRRQRHGGRGGPRGDLGVRHRHRPGRGSSPPASATPTASTSSRRPASMWTVSNERDEIGNDLPPDYLTSVKDGGFYGWPYSYWGQQRRRARQAAAPGPGRQGDRARLRPRARTPPRWA